MSNYVISDTLVRNPVLRGALQCFMPGLVNAIKDSCKTADEYREACADGRITFGSNWTHEDAIAALSSARNFSLVQMSIHPKSRWMDIFEEIIENDDIIASKKDVSELDSASTVCVTVQKLMQEAYISIDDLVPASGLFPEPGAHGSSFIADDVVWQGVLRDWRVNDGEDDDLTEQEKRDFAVRITGGDGTMLIEIDTIDGPMALGFEMDHGAAKFATYLPTGPEAQAADEVIGTIRVDERGMHVTANHHHGLIEHVLFDQHGCGYNDTEWEPVARSNEIENATHPK